MRRNLKSFFAETILPIAFICLGIFILNFAPKIENKPLLELHPWLSQTTWTMNRMFYKPGHLGTDIDEKIWNTFLTRPGPGTRCLPNHRIFVGDEANSRLGCQTFDFKVSSLSKPFNQSIKCTCETGFMKCVGNSLPKKYHLRTTDVMYDLKGIDVEQWLLRTEFDPEFMLNLYGGFEFVESDSTSVKFLDDLKEVLVSTLDLADTYGNSGDLGKKYAQFVRSHPLYAKQTIKVWYNNKGWILLNLLSLLK